MPNRPDFLLQKWPPVLELTLDNLFATVGRPWLDEDSRTPGQLLVAPLNKGLSTCDKRLQLCQQLAGIPMRGIDAPDPRVKLGVMLFSSINSCRLNSPMTTGTGAVHMVSCYEIQKTLTKPWLSHSRSPWRPLLSINTKYSQNGSLSTLHVAFHPDGSHSSRRASVHRQRTPLGRALASLPDQPGSLNHLRTLGKMG